MVGAHLYDGDFRFRRNGQQAQRNAYVVVQVALGGRNVIFLPQHGGNEVLCSGLSVGAGKAEHGQLAAAHMGAVPDCKVAQRSERVCHADKAPVFRQIRIVIHHSPRSTAFQRLGCKRIAVKILSP